jgi:hypothetical protein
MWVFAWGVLLATKGVVVVTVCELCLVYFYHILLPGFHPSFFVSLSCYGRKAPRGTVRTQQKKSSALPASAGLLRITGKHAVVSYGVWSGKEREGRERERVDRDSDRN